MKYEIPREAFKQRLEERLNFVLVDLAPNEIASSNIKDVLPLSYDSRFKEEFSSKYPLKTQNILLYSLKENDTAPAKAATELAEMGYHFVYFYNGSAEDLILEKGIN